MLPAVFTLIAVSSWTYAGFLARPTPAPTPAPTPTPAVPTGSPVSGPATPPPAPPVVVGPPTVAPKAASSSPDPSPPGPEPTEEDPPSSPTEPRRYQLADVTGQVWEHTDPAWLQEFVRDRNRRLLGSPP